MEKKKYSKKEYEAELKKTQEICKQLKKNLKLRTKSQLIEIIIAYSSDLQEMQNAARQLFEENKALKESLNEKVD